MPFNKLAAGTAADWAVIGRELRQRQATLPHRIAAMLRQLERQIDGFAVNQMQHALQTATRAWRDDAGDEWVAGRADGRSVH